MNDALATANAGLAEVAEAAGPGMLALLDRTGNVYSSVPLVDEALDFADRQLQLAERLRDPGGIIDGIINRVSILTGVGRLMEAALLVDGVRRLAEQSGTPRQAVKVTLQQGLIDGSEAPTRAIEIAREGAAAARRVGSTNELAIIVLNGGESAFHTGDWAWSRREYAGVLAMELGVTDRLVVTANARLLDVLTGRRDEELEATVAEVLTAPDEGMIRTFKRDLEFWPAWLAGEYDQCVENQLFIAATDPLNAPTAYTWAIRAASWKGDPALAREVFDGFRALGRRSNMLDAMLAAADANVAGVEGRSDDAERRYREAIAMFDALGCAFDVAQTALDAVVALGAGTPFGREMAGVAQPILERLEARPYLDKLASLEAAAVTADLA